MVFQNYALYPHMTVYENMAFGLKLHRVEARRRSAPRVEPTAQMLGIGDLLQRKPAQLSGGQRQRVAMGRAIVREPEAFLMDEPLSNLDAKLRVEMRAYVALLHRQLRTTTLYVTHDQVEAMTMGDRVAVMRDGRLEQCGAPQALYDRPANTFVAGFIGSPAMNLAAVAADRRERLAVRRLRRGASCGCRPRGARAATRPRRQRGDPRRPPGGSRGRRLRPGRERLRRRPDRRARRDDGRRGGRAPRRRPRRAPQPARAPRRRARPCASPSTSSGCISSIRRARPRSDDRRVAAGRPPPPRRSRLVGEEARTALAQPNLPQASIVLFPFGSMG